MLSVALRTLRARWTGFVGSFVALALGVALLTVMGLALAATLDAPDRAPERFAAAPLVVRGADTLRVATPIGDRTQPLAEPRPLPTTAVAELRRLGRVTPDRSFAVRVPGGPGDLVGHPWSVAAFAPYEIVSGRAPRTADEVVVSGSWTRPGRRLGTDRGSVTVVGTVTDRGFEHAVFYTDARAARLAPRSTQLVVDADVTAVRNAVRDVPGVRVLTGDGRRYADPDPDRDRAALTALNALFGTAGGVTGFVSVFVVASTFAFAVAQRRREFGLLRTAGATPGQLRRTVLAEALLVGVVASAAGCVLGGYGAPVLVRRTVHSGLAPAWFRIPGHARPHEWPSTWPSAWPHAWPHAWPYCAAFATGLLVALCGALAASWRAGRIGPMAALREADVDNRPMTRSRWAFGTGLLLTAAVLLFLGTPGDLLHRKTYVTRPMLLITGVALLAPVVVRPLTRLLTWAPARLPGAGGLLVREHAAAAVRRTAAVAAPVLVTVALTGSLLGTIATLNAARAAEVRDRTAADFVVTPPGGDGFDAETVRALRAVPGAEVSASAGSAVYVLEDGVALIRSGARAADPAALAATARLPLAAGRTADLDDGSIIVNEEWARHTVGERVRVWLGDGTERTLRIAAVLRTGTGDNGVYVTPANAAGAAVDRVDVALRDGADPAAVAAGLRAALGERGGRVRTADRWIAAVSPGTDRTTRLGFLLVLGIALLYTGISLVNTMVMATADRTRELALLRLAGATRGQALRLVGAEALTVVAVGALLGLLVAGLDLAGIAAALRLQSAPAPVRLPWPALGAAVTACALLAVTAAVVPAARTLRHSTPAPG
ncbi:FtsX-like permease family protein [Streptomyces sp. NPDC051016]|uniref:ABC transporter permease n=1 Tax=Streptomyces sp. NPDC051016 TaxID=3365638 RepID=UPI003798F2FA